MKIAIDLRPLLEARGTRGVEVYTRELLQAFTLHGSEHRWVGFVNAWSPNVILSPSTTLRADSSKDLIPDSLVIPDSPRDPGSSYWIPDPRQVGVRNNRVFPVVKKTIPNKLLNLSLLTTDRPHLDKWSGGADVWIAPNLNFTSVSPRCKLIQVVHDLSFLVDPSWYSLKSRMWHRAIRVQKVLNRADVIVAISKATAADIARHFPQVAHKITVVYPGAPTAPIITPEDQQTIRKKYRLPARFFLYVGALEPRKNIATLLDAFAHFTHTTAYPHELILAGPGTLPLPLRESLTESLTGRVNAGPGRASVGPGARVRGIGRVSEKEKQALLSLAEALVFPSLYEGFGFPPLEAMSHGTPVIASWSTSLPEVVGDAGLLISPYKPHELAHAMRMIADHQDVREDLSQRALKRAQQFTWEKTAQEFLKICTS